MTVLLEKVLSLKIQLYSREKKPHTFYADLLYPLEL
jgi:hypothetical protein